MFPKDSVTMIILFMLDFSFFQQATQWYTQILFTIDFGYMQALKN